MLDWATGTYNPFVDVTKDSTTLYASDRDVFMFLVDDTHPIEVGKLSNGDPDLVFRGFYVWNSEVGKTALGLSTFLLRGVCCNRNIWGAQDVNSISVRHNKHAPTKFVTDMQPKLIEYADSSDRLVIARHQRSTQGRRRHKRRGPDGVPRSAQVHRSARAQGDRDVRTGGGPQARIRVGLRAGHQRSGTQHPASGRTDRPGTAGGLDARQGSGSGGVMPDYPIGRKIVDVRWMRQDEVQTQGWWYTAPTVPVFVLDDGSLVWPSGDDAGEIGGTFFCRIGARQFIITPRK